MIMGGPTLGVEWSNLLTGESTVGIIVSTHFCPVSAEWYMLVAEDGGRFHNVKASDLSARVVWHYEVMDIVDDDDNDAEEFDE
jgi:hypothetical protein